jgi:hypothetical protein
MTSMRILFYLVCLPLTVASGFLFDRILVIHGRINKLLEERKHDRESG